MKSLLDLRLIVSRRYHEYIAENHQHIFNRSTRFLEMLLFGVTAIIVVAVAYVFSRIVI